MNPVFRWAAVAVLALAVTAPVSRSSAAERSRQVGDSRVVAQLPAAPGYPEGIAVRGNRVYVATAARVGTAVVPPLDPPEVQVFDKGTGELVARHVVLDADESRDHGLSGLAFDGAGRLYVLDTQWGVLRFDPAAAPGVIDPRRADHYDAYVYSPEFPDLPSSPAPALPNDLAFDKQGNLYVTDSLQAVVWRIRPADRRPEAWLSVPTAGAFGPNGIRLDPSGQALYLVVSVDLVGRGHVHRVTFDGRIEPTPLFTYVGGEVPDNLAVGRSGRLYVALAGTNQVQVLDPSGRELGRYGGPARRDDGTAVPYDMPSGVALDASSGAVLVNNHSEVLGLPERFVVFDVFVDDHGELLARPDID